MVEKFEGRMDEDLEGEEEMEEMVEGDELVRVDEEEIDQEEAAIKARNIVRVRPMQLSRGEEQGKELHKNLISGITTS